MGKHTLDQGAHAVPGPLGAPTFLEGNRRSIRTSWEKVFDAVEHVVTYGLEHRCLGQIDAIGVDEIQYAKGHKYLTLVYQIDLGITRLLWLARNAQSNPSRDSSLPGQRGYQQDLIRLFRHVGLVAAAP